MGVILQRIEDGRIDNLDKMLPDEVRAYAKANGVEFDKDILISDYTSLNRPNLINILRSRGLHGFDCSDRVLGSSVPPRSKPIKEILGQNAETPNPQPVETQPAVDKPVSQMNIRELRMACRQRAIKMERTDNIARLREKLSAA